MKDLGISGTKLTLRLKTITGEKSEGTEEVDGLIVSAVDCKKGRLMEWIELSEAYSMNGLPVERDEIATPAKIKRSEYLKPISKVITRWTILKLGCLLVQTV